MRRRWRDLRKVTQEASCCQSRDKPLTLLNLVFFLVTSFNHLTKPPFSRLLAPPLPFGPVIHLRRELQEASCYEMWKTTKTRIVFFGSRTPKRKNICGNPAGQFRASHCLKYSVVKSWVDGAGGLLWGDIWTEPWVTRSQPMGKSGARMFQAKTTAGAKLLGKQVWCCQTWLERGENG